MKYWQTASSSQEVAHTQVVTSKNARFSSITTGHAFSAQQTSTCLRNGAFDARPDGRTRVTREEINKLFYYNQT